MTREEFLALAALYGKTCSRARTGLLDGLICTLIQLLNTLEITVIANLAELLGIDLGPVIRLVVNLLSSLVGPTGLLGGGLLGGLLGGGLLG